MSSREAQRIPINTTASLNMGRKITNSGGKIKPQSQENFPLPDIFTIQDLQPARFFFPTPPVHREGRELRRRPFLLHSSVDGGDGRVDITVDLSPPGADWTLLQYDRNETTSRPVHGENFSARTTFGIFKGNSHPLYPRQTSRQPPSPDFAFQKRRGNFPGPIPGRNSLQNDKIRHPDLTFFVRIHPKLSPS